MWICSRNLMFFNFLHDKWEKWQTKKTFRNPLFYSSFFSSAPFFFIWMKRIVFVITYFSPLFFCHQINYFSKHFTFHIVDEAAAKKELDGNENEWASFPVWCLSAKAAQKFISMYVREGKSPIMQKARWAWHYQARAQSFRERLRLCTSSKLLSRMRLFSATLSAFVW